LLFRGEPKGALAATLCELVKAPEQYQGDLIQLRAAVSPSGADTLPILSDRSCSVPVRFEVPDALIKDQVYQGLGYYLQRRVVEATFWGAAKQVLVPHGQTYLRFNLQLVHVDLAR
jgi:hypothetical protein